MGLQHEERKKGLQPTQSMIQCLLGGEKVKGEEVGTGAASS